MCSTKVWDKVLSEEAYEQKLAENPSLMRFIRNLESFLVNGRTILECGCGSGINTLLLSKKFGLECFLVDFSKKSFEIVRRFAKELNVSYNFILADCRYLPFKEGNCDVVWNEGVNEHFNGYERQLVFNEMIRACKFKGGILVSVPNSLNLYEQIIIRAKGFPYGFEKPYSSSELKERLIRAGASIFSTDGYGFWGSIINLLVFLTKRGKVFYRSMHRQITADSKKHEIIKKIGRLLRVLDYQRNWLNKYFGYLIVCTASKIRKNI
jgi:ubiquinone/menaquinone biosynthesis C-methylase UbiE